MTMEQLMKELEKSKDPHRFMASHVLGKTIDEVTREERIRFKEAFYALFHFKGPDIIRGCFEELRELNNLPAVRDHYLTTRLDKEKTTK